MGKQVRVRNMAQSNADEVGLSVIVRGNSPADFQKALRKFKRKVNDSGVLQDLREKEYYEKPSDRKRKAKKAAVRRQQRLLQQEKEQFSPHSRRR